MLVGALSASAYFLMAHVEFGHGWPLAVCVVACSLASAPLAGALCLSASALQDARGLPSQPALAVVVGCGLSCLLRGGWPLLTASTRALRFSLAACAMAVVIALVASVAGLLGWGFSQSGSRPPIGVAVADLAMPVIGASAGVVAIASRAGSRMLSGAMFASLALIAARIAVQGGIAPDAGFSESGRESIIAARQLSGDTALGQVRFVGSMLTPNAMSLTVTLLVLAAWTAMRPRSFGLALLAGATLVAAAVLAGSKSSLIVAVVAAAVLAASTSWRWSMATLACVIAASLVPVLSDGPVDWRAIESRMRIDVIESDTIRSTAWRACVAELHPADALLGMGLSHWPDFFERTIGVRMADPHSAVFSYPWTYGVSGPVALALTSWCIIRAAARGGSPAAPALTILSILLVRDMVAIPLLIGTTVLTLQLWACIAMVLARDTR
jgi:hypothetical protein